MRTALASFINSLNRVRDIAQDIDANAGQALASIPVLMRHETIQCASTVILSGYFESFIKAAAEAFIRDLCQKGRPFSQLPEDIRHSHFIEGGRILAESANAKRKNRVSWILADGPDISRRLHSVSASSPYELVWEAFADTGANPGPDIVKDFLGRFGISKVWPNLAAKMGVSENLAIAQLKSFIAVRNECAHTGAARHTPTPSELREYCDLLEKTGTGMIALLEDYLAVL